MSTRMKPARTIEEAIEGQWYAVFAVEPVPTGLMVCSYRDNYRTPSGVKRFLTWVKKNGRFGFGRSLNAKYYRAIIEVRIKELKPQ